MWPGVAFAASTITGTVTFDGKPPALKPIAMDADPACAKKHTAPVQNEALELGSGNTMANIMVYVTKGLPAGKTYPAPTTPVVIDQNGCQYKPHVMGIMVGQPYRILNSDGILHNIHTTSTANPPSNQAQPKFKPKIQIKVEKPETIGVKCDVHGWMSGYWISEEHPYYAVTDANGAFKIADIPPGDYDVDIWQEKLGKKTEKASIKAKDETKVAWKLGPAK
jgi:plastocyanin